MEGNAAVTSLGCCEFSYQNYKERDYVKNKIFSTHWFRPSTPALPHEVL